MQRLVSLSHLAIRTLALALALAAVPACGGGTSNTGDDLAQASGADLAQAGGADLAQAGAADMAMAPAADLATSPDLTETFGCAEYANCFALGGGMCATPITSPNGQMLWKALVDCGTNACKNVPPCQLGNFDFMKCQACIAQAAQSNTCTTQRLDCLADL